MLLPVLWLVMLMSSRILASIWFKQPTDFIKEFARAYKPGSEATNHSPSSLFGTRQMSPDSNISLDSILIHSFLQAWHLYQKENKKPQKDRAGRSKHSMLLLQIGHRWNHYWVWVWSPIPFHQRNVTGCPQQLSLVPKTWIPIILNEWSEYSNESYCILFCIFNSLVLIAV